MKNNTWKLVVLLGILMIASAGMLCLYNIRQSKNAATYSESVLDTLKHRIPEPEPEPAPQPAETAAVPEKEDLFAYYEESTDAPVQSEAADIVIGNAAYCGYLTLPSLNLELPVMSSWSYQNLRLAPCRYSGSVQTNDLIIMAHNYSTHFGRIGELTNGSRFSFTDTAGTEHLYTVSFIEVIAGQDAEQMFSGQSADWDLTLYTCTLSGQSRITIRAYRLDKPAEET